jgi:hypothetical protein
MQKAKEKEHAALRDPVDGTSTSLRLTKTKTNHCGLSPRGKCTDRETATCRRS